MKILLAFLFLTACGMPKGPKVQGLQDPLRAKDCNQTSGAICAQPPMPPCPSNMLCAQVMPPLKKYDNECKMQEAKASFIKNGECP